jgi:cell division protein YceG involved in septum cleavage
LSLNEVLTLASLVQRESALDSEMPLVAQNLLNRISDSDASQVDATFNILRVLIK